MIKVDGWTEKEKKKGNSGQGDIYIVEPTEDNKKIDRSKKYVLKELKEQKNMTARRRMYQEVSNLKSLPPNGRILQVIDTNVDKYEDLSEELFFISEFIDGATLLDTIRKGRYNFDDIINSFIEILDAVKYCHDNGVIHRDIKPNNIMCKKGNLSDIILIDFGLSFNEEDDIGVTQWKDHLGNRFLELPELKSEKNKSKRDRRSDITFCCGILFFMITKKFPVVLQNENREKPHQISENKEIIEEYNINNIFDIGFNIDINYRFQSIEALKNEIETLIKKRHDIKETSQKNTMKELIQSININEIKETDEILDCFINTANEAAEKLKTVIEGIYIYGFDRSKKYDEYYVKQPYIIRVEHIEDLEFVTTFMAQINGSEIVVSMIKETGKEEIYRVALKTYKDTLENLKDKIIEYYENNLDRIAKDYKQMESDKKTVKFDYSKNNGEYTIGEGDEKFTTKWSSANNTAMYVYSDSGNISQVGYISGRKIFPRDIKELKTFNYTTNCISVHIREVVIWKNNKSKYMVTKIMSIKSTISFDKEDEIELSYKIY